CISERSASTTDRVSRATKSLPVSLIVQTADARHLRPTPRCAAASHNHLVTVYVDAMTFATQIVCADNLTVKYSCDSIQFTTSRFLAERESEAGLEFGGPTVRRRRKDAVQNQARDAEACCRRRRSRCDNDCC